MSAIAKIIVNFFIDGLGKGVEKKEAVVLSVTPEITAGSLSQTQETADVAEALNIGGIDTVEGIWIVAKENDLAIDTSWVEADDFCAEIIVKEGEPIYFRPSGTVYIKNNVETEKVTFEYFAWGTQD